MIIIQISYVSRMIYKALLFLKDILLNVKCNDPFKMKTYPGVSIHSPQKIQCAYNNLYQYIYQLRSKILLYINTNKDDFKP